MGFPSKNYTKSYIGLYLLHIHTSIPMFSHFFITISYEPPTVRLALYLFLAQFQRVTNSQILAQQLQGPPEPPWEPPKKDVQLMVSEGSPKSKGNLVHVS